MFNIDASNKFLKDLRLLKKRSVKDLAALKEIISLLAENGHRAIPPKHVPHKLSGKYKGYWECHVKPDLLLIWEEKETLRLIELVRTGTHSDLF